ncbi:contactin-associated protein-like 5 [Stegastes partitus]|uniref:Contactin-associated protein-like 5 n=1 Tax=Stegastes partitus TaxID=144197 RepID=A0A9Y4KDE1_9TELE|nr:PREDICTED: contactin-associated protein-like 5 [Stegastes partitus]
MASVGSDPNAQGDEFYHRFRFAELLQDSSVVPEDNCNGPLVSALPHSSFQSSSQSSVGYAAHNAKLNRRDGAGGWSPMVTDQEPWLQVDLREQMEVTAVATQGRHDSWDWVSSYLLLYSDTGRAWKQYRQEDGVGRIVGNVNSEAVVQNKLTHPVRTRFLRFVPLDWNPSGWMGLRVEVYGCSYKSYVADFDGRSSLLYRFNQKSMSTVKDVISLRFKSHQTEGVLLHGEGQRGDYITLELHRGRLDFYLNLGEPARLLFCFLSVPLCVQLSFGGIPLPGKPGTFLRKNFHGCMENLYYNGINIVDLAKRRKPQIHSVGNVTFSCSPPQLVACTFLSSSSSFLSLPSAPPPPLPASGGFAVRFQFRTWNPDGLLLSAQLNPSPQKLELQISSGWLRLSLHGSGRQKSEASAGHRVSDGLWHSVRLDTRNLHISLTVDGEPSSTIELWDQVESRGNFYLGGCPTMDCHAQTPAFQGCMQLVFINGQPVNLSHVQQGLLGNYNELQFDTCSIKDSCRRTRRCDLLAEPDRKYVSSSSSSSFTAELTVKDRQRSSEAIYESSCEAYKLSGSSSGFYFIDPDGSGPLGPAQVYCNMTEKKVWTVLSHNSSAPVTVQSSSLQKPHVMKLNYSASAEQLRAIVSGSEQCQQEVVYSCRKSRLFNTRDGSPLSWWLDREGERRSYWGGFLPGVQQCSCSLEENCVDMNYFCNCDADTDSWTNDTGVLSYKDHLPVSQVVVGDTNRTGSMAVYHVGPLRCYGDKSIWNAASFYQEASYLYFPTLQAELASDISFYFKTSAPSGVFLENQGLKDFIRVELSAPSAVTFSFDVGNGPAVLSVKSHLPLNDRQWHYVRAERNVKEASLQVDQLPLRFLQAPADGHLRLRLSSQLFVGGTASQQRGFLGCIRSLTVNGAVLDLEERARMTPGVSSGCPGYCSGSSSLCHNRGRCVEKSNGYICDCSQLFLSPCVAEVSVSFDRESSVTYTFQEPFSVMQNRSSQASSVSTDSRAREDVAFSFVTSQRPAMLLTVSTFSQQYIAVILARNGSLQIWYHLQTDRSPDVFSPALGNLADGRLHRIRIHRVGKNLYIQIDQDIHRKYTLSSDAELILIRSLTLGKVTRMENLNEEVVQAAAKGFVGCLSSVQFNHVAPLKAALTNRGSSLITIRGPLVQSNCGALAESTSHTLQDQAVTANKDKEQRGGDGGGGGGGGTQKDLAVIAGVVTAVVFIAVCALAVISRLLYQQRRAQRGGAGGGGGGGGVKDEHRHSMYTDYRTELHLHNSVRDNVKEYYI